MARNEEKAMGLLNRWTTFRREQMLGTGKTGRRGWASECDNLGEALARRREVVKEVTEKISEIQNAGLGEHRIRELNDEINKVLREKHRWEQQIRKLGGPTQFGDGKRTDSEKGFKYKYFGAARELPQVRELLAPPVVKKNKKRKREEILKNITSSYFESIDSERKDRTGLYAAERREEALLAAKRQKSNENKLEEINGDDQDASEFDQLLLKTIEYSSLAFLTPEQREDLNTSQAAEKLLVAKKKKELLAKYLL